MLHDHDTYCICINVQHARRNTTGLEQIRIIPTILSRLFAIRAFDEGAMTATYYMEGEGQRVIPLTKRDRGKIDRRTFRAGRLAVTDRYIYGSQHSGAAETSAFLDQLHSSTYRLLFWGQDGSFLMSRTFSQ